MIAEDHLEELTAICRRYGVRRLDLFGSAAAAQSFDSVHSDLDFLVEFGPIEGMGPADQFFGMWEELKQLYGREIDLVTTRSLRNPYFIQSVNRTRRLLYAS